QKARARTRHPSSTHDISGKDETEHTKVEKISEARKAVRSVFCEIPRQPSMPHNVVGIAKENEGVIKDKHGGIGEAPNPRRQAENQDPVSDLRRRFLRPGHVGRRAHLSSLRRSGNSSCGFE